MAEYKQLSHNPPDGELDVSVLPFLTKVSPGIAAGPVTEENFFEWEAAITGPEGTYFEDGVFIATLSFPQDYPLNPPKMRFKSELFHPNIYPDGRVCIRKVIGTGLSAVERTILFISFHEPKHY